MRGADVHGSESGSEPGATGETGVDHEFLALERELTVFLRRARSSSGEMAREVHPDLESAAYGLLVRLESARPAAGHRSRRRTSASARPP